MFKGAIPTLKVDKYLSNSREERLNEVRVDSW